MLLSERLLTGLLLAMLVAYAATPIAIGVANRMQFFDRPRGYKAHARPTPYLGGAAVMAGFAMAVLLLAGHWDKTAPLLTGVALLWLVGTIDDRHTVSPWSRVSVELALAWLVWRSGLGWTLHMGSALDLVLTCLWVVAVINAFNLFDNMDGAAGTMALAVSAGAALLGVVRSDSWLAVGAASLGGACLGFLPRNLSRPARIFLGDGGSMPVGFVAAVLVMVAAGTSATAWQSLPVALLLVGLPALDTTLVIVSRRRRGVPVMTGGKDHLTHRTHRLAPSARAVALVLGGAQAVVSVTAVLAVEGGSSFVVVAAILYTLVALGAIFLLDSGGAEQLAAEHSEAQPTKTRPSLPAIALLSSLGLAAGVSPFFFAYYDPGTWVAIGLGVVLLSAIGVVARPHTPGAPAALALAGLLGLGVWSLSSTAWTESVEGAVVSGNRWLLYGALLLLLLVLVRSHRRAATALAGAGVGVAVVALSVLIRLLGHAPGNLFLGGRLNAPLGYINGEGCLFAMGFWLCLAVAESRRALLSGIALGSATLMACFALLSQSRGTALAMTVATVAVMVLLPGRTRRAYAVMLAVAAVAVASPSLLHVYSSAAGGSVSAAAGRQAGRAALLAALAAGSLWAALNRAWEAARVGLRDSTRLRSAASWALAAPALAALAIAGGAAGSIEHELSVQWRAFTHLSAPGVSTSSRQVDTSVETSSAESRSRLLSGAGNRYDYWRIAWGLWREHPLVGVGAGGYTRYYYERRATTEDVDQPHSVELEALADLGIVGGALLGAFIAAVAWGAWRMRRGAGSSRLVRATAVAATGSFAAWTAQGSVDWMHLLPGLTAMALIAAVALVWPRHSAPSPVRAPAGRARVLGACAVLATLVIAGASLSRQALAQLYAERAQRELPTRPAGAATDADRALELDPDAVQAYYVKAAALARFDQGRAAEATLRRALAREPRNFVTWALLGDVAVREGRQDAARLDYRRAHTLNPRNPTLTRLASRRGAAP